MLTKEVKSKVAFVLVLKVCFMCSGQAQAFQGRLGQVRNQVRENQKQHQDHDHSNHQHEDDDGEDSHSNSSGGRLNQVRNQVRQNHNQNFGHDHSDDSGHRRNRVSRRHDLRCNSRRGRANNYYGFFDSHSFHNHFHDHRRYDCRPYNAPCIDYCDPVIRNEIVLTETYVQPALPEVGVYDSPVDQVQLLPPNGDYLFDDFATWTLRGSATIGANFDDLSQGGLNLLLQAPGNLGLDTSVTTLREQDSNIRDHLWLGDVNFVYEPICNEVFRMRFGAGLTWLGDAYGGEAGFNLTGGFDLKLTEKLTLSGEADLGTLGDSDFWHGRINLSRKIGRAEWLVGIDHYDIGGVNFHNVFTGIGFRF